MKEFVFTVVIFTRNLQTSHETQRTHHSQDLCNLSPYLYCFFTHQHVVDNRYNPFSSSSPLPCDILLMRIIHSFPIHINSHSSSLLSLLVYFSASFCSPHVRTMQKRISEEQTQLISHPHFIHIVIIIKVSFPSFFS